MLNVKKGGIVTRILVILIIVIITTAVILYLVQAGIISPKPAGEEVDILNANFIPISNEGVLVIKQLDLCRAVDDQLNCYVKSETFSINDPVYIRALVVSTAVSGKLKLTRSYKMTDSSGNVILTLDQENERVMETPLSENKEESLAFSDAIFFNSDLNPGEYNLELVVTNPDLQKKTTIVRRVTLTE